MKRLMAPAVLLLLCCTSNIAIAGPFADEMAKCLVSSTSPQDRTLLVRWIFSLMAMHPDLTAMANVSDKQRVDLTKQTGQLFQRLLLDSCRSQTQTALQNEGS
jgi:hypothetical protein